MVEDLKYDIDELMEYLEDLRKAVTHYKEACANAFKNLREAKQEN